MSPPATKGIEMAEIDDGGPAFPMQVNDLVGSFEGGPGMSLRDYFAAAALTAAVELASNMSEMLDGKSREVWAADKAYAVADAMLLARSRKEGQDNG